MYLSLLLKPGDVIYEINIKSIITFRAVLCMLKHFSSILKTIFFIMVICSVPKCCSRSDRGGAIDADGNKLTFHLFPHNAERRKAWAVAIKRQGEKPNVLWCPKSHSSVCSRHFTEKDFNHSCKKKVLLPSAIPSVFTDDRRFLLRKPNVSKRRARWAVVQEGNVRTLKKISAPSKNLSLSSSESISKEKDQKLVSKEKEINKTLFPSDPKLIEIRSCLENRNDLKPTQNNCESDNLPSFVKQALIEKEKIDRTYDNTSDEDSSISMRNGNVEPEVSDVEEEPFKNNPDISYTFFNQCGSDERKLCANSNIINVPYIRSLSPESHNTVNTNPTHVFLPVISGIPTLVPQNITDRSCILSNKLSYTTKTPAVKMCDASTSTEMCQDVEAKLKSKLEDCYKLIADYRKKIKVLQQQNRRKEKKDAKCLFSLYLKTK